MSLSKDELSVIAYNNFIVNFQDFFHSPHKLDFYIMFQCGWLSLKIFSGYDRRTLQGKENWYLTCNSFIPKYASWDPSFLENNKNIYFISYLTIQLITVTVVLLQYISNFNIWHRKYFVVIS